MHTTTTGPQCLCGRLATSRALSQRPLHRSVKLGATCGHASDPGRQRSAQHLAPHMALRQQPSSCRHQQRPVHCRAASEVAAPPQSPQAPSKPANMEPDWKLMEKLRASGQTQQGTIREANKGGLIVELQIGGKGFTPFSKVDPARLLDSQNQVRHPDSIDEIDEEVIPDAQPKRKRLTGQPIAVKVVQVDAGQKTLLLSEVATKKEEFMAEMSEGDTVSGTVRTLTDYGAFVELKFLDGRMHGVEGLVHKSELSWQKVAMPENVVKEGDQVKCQIITLDPSRGRINLSMKRLQSDPLEATLDNMLPIQDLQDEDKLLHVPSYVPANVEKVCDFIARQPGIDSLRMGRQVEEKGAISQDLELYISKDHVEDGYNLIARSEGRVQEIHLTTGLDTKSLKQLVQSVLRRLL